MKKTTIMVELTVAEECTHSINQSVFRTVVNVTILPQEGFFMIYTDPSEINLEPEDDLYVKLFYF